MTLNVYEWFSYSCNNSSDHRVVAEFDSHEKAQAMAEELRALFQAHAEQGDAANEEGEDWPQEQQPSPALTAFAEKYGTEVGEGMLWGDGDLFVDDLPEIAVLDRTVYVYHGYMSGFGDLSGVLENAGAQHIDEDRGAACFQFTATAKPGEAASLQQALDRFFAQRETTDNLCDWECPFAKRLPIYTAMERVLLVHAEDRSTFSLAIGAKAVPKLIGWLEANGASTVEAKLAGDEELAALREAEQRSQGRPHYTTTVFHRVVVDGPQQGWANLVTQIVVRGERVVLCGGGGKNLLLVSDDGGKTFVPRSVDVGTGLRCYFEDGEATYVCGQSGLLARSRDGGRTFEAVTTGAVKCAQTVLRADGALWSTGDSGAFRSVDDGVTWTKIDAIEGEIARPQDSELGLLLPTSEGRLFISRGGMIHPTGLEAAGAIWAACVTPKGTIIAVGEPGILRSTDKGATFEHVTKARGSLQNVACTASGRLVVVGQNGVLLHSGDDGASFQRVEQRHTKDWLFAVTAVGERVLVGGMNGWVLEVHDAATLAENGRSDG